MPFSRIGAPTHGSISGVTTSQHHVATVAGDLNLADMAARAHGDLSDAPADAHHDQSHTIVSHSDTPTVVQMVETQIGTVVSGTGTFPSDDTIPQITEGSEFMTLAITPLNAGNRLIIEVLAQVNHSVANLMYMALFRDADASAKATSGRGDESTTVMRPFVMVHEEAAGGVVAQTWRVRMGGQSASTITLNGDPAARMGGTLASGIRIWEVEA